MRAGLRCGAAELGFLGLGLLGVFALAPWNSTACAPPTPSFSPSLDCVSFVRFRSGDLGLSKGDIFGSRPAPVLVGVTLFRFRYHS